MKVRILLIGLGRIGKLIARGLLSSENPLLEWVGSVEQRKDPELFSYLLNHDSTYGRLPTPIGFNGDGFELPRSRKVPLFDNIVHAIKETSPKLVIDCSGSAEVADILISSIALNKVNLFARFHDVLKKTKDTQVWVYGVNDPNVAEQPPKHIINPGCLNNCLIPLISCLDDHFSIEKGTFVSVHSVTNTQPTLDLAGLSPRWSRASGTNLVPAVHSQMELISKFFPSLENKLIGTTIRAPIHHTSYVTCNFQMRENIEIDTVIKSVSNTKISPTVIGIDHEPLVSSDYVTDGRSCVIDRTSIRVLDRSTLMISAWYNNEYAFACRMLDIASRLSQIY